MSNSVCVSDSEREEASKDSDKNLCSRIVVRSLIKIMSFYLQNLFVQMTETVQKLLVLKLHKS